MRNYEHTVWVFTRSPATVLLVGILIQVRMPMLQNALHSFFLKISTIRIVILLAILTVFSFWIIQVHGIPGIPLFKTILRIGIPDMMLTYAPASIHDKLVRFGPEGRTAYRVFLQRVDFVFPAIYGLFLVTVTTLGLSRLFSDRPVLQKIGLLTLFTTFFDWTENVFYLVLLRHYPEDLAGTAKVANVLTLAKWAFAVFSVVLMLVAIAGLLYRSGSAKQPELRQT
jgi:hypothetical protein